MAALILEHPSPGSPAAFARSTTGSRAKHLVFTCRSEDTQASRTWRSNGTSHLEPALAGLSAQPSPPRGDRDAPGGRKWSQFHHEMGKRPPSGESDSYLFVGSVPVRGDIATTCYLDSTLRGREGAQRTPVTALIADRCGYGPRHDHRPEGFCSGAGTGCGFHSG